MQSIILSRMKIMSVAFLFALITLPAIACTEVRKVIPPKLDQAH